MRTVLALICVAILIAFAFASSVHGQQTFDCANPPQLREGGDYHYLYARKQMIVQTWNGCTLVGIVDGQVMSIHVGFEHTAKTNIHQTANIVYDPLTFASAYTSWPLNPFQGTTAAETTISGRITLNGNALPGVTVTIIGDRMTTTTTDSSGNYQFTVEAGSFITITPSLFGHTFAPGNRSLSVLGTTTVDFAAFN